MKSLNLLFVISLMLIPGYLQAQADAPPKRATDPSPSEVKKLYSKWDDPQKEGKSFSMTPKDPGDVWYNTYSKPVDGYVFLTTGEKINGKIVKHRRYNKASTTDAEPGSKDPKEKYSNGVNYIEDVRIFLSDGSSKVFPTTELLTYGVNFMVADWSPNPKSRVAADNYFPGYVKFADGTTREGVVALETMTEEIDGFRLFNMVYFGREKSSNVEILFPPLANLPALPVITEAGQTANDKMIRYSLYQGTLIDVASWVTLLESDPKKLKAESLASGEMLFDNGITLKGRFAMNAGNKKTSAFFLDEGNDLYNISASREGIKVLNITAAGKQARYSILDGKFVDNASAIADFEKDKELHEGVVVLTDGRKLEGRITFKRMVNVIKSYRLPIGVYFVPAGGVEPVVQYGPDAIDYVEEVVGGQRAKYIPIEGVLVKSEELLSSLESRKSKDETKNLQKGYVVFSDGKKVQGRIAKEKTSVYFVGEGNKIEKYNARTPGVTCFVQNINGADRKFIALEHGITAFEDRGFQYVEVLLPAGDYSYYRNPDPTHLKEGTTKLVKGVVNTVTDVGSMALAKEVASAQVKEELKNSSNNLSAVSAATVNAASSMGQTMQMTKDMVQLSDEGGIYHKEWVVVNNKTNEKVVVYKKNAEEEMKVLLAGCSKYVGLDKKDVKRLTNIDNLEEAVKFLNDCKN